MSNLQNHPSIPESFKRHVFRKHVLLPFAGCFILLVLILYFNQAQKCTATDFSANGKDRTYTGLTIGEACRKAVAVCTYFSADPKNCRVKQLMSQR